MVRIESKVVFCIAVFFLLSNGLAGAWHDPNRDIEGSKDHPLFSRYEGSIIIGYDVKGFDEYVLPLGSFEGDRPSKSQSLHGKVTRIRYKAPMDSSTLEIYLNYEMALTKAGFEILFAGKREELGGHGEWAAILYDNNLKYYAELMGEVTHQRYLAAKLVTPAGDIYVSLFVTLGYYDFPVVQFDVIEVKPMEAGLVTVNVAALAESIAKVGHVAIYSIYFDTGKAEIKPESEPALKDIAEFLRKNRDLDLYVIGHTDNVGTLDFNMNLSQRRAEAVVEALVSRHGIARERLHPVGIGPLSPVTSNRTEEGRAKNRRVELVER